MNTANNKIIIFDGICNLCNATVQFILKRDKNSIFKFVPMQSEIAIKFSDKFNIDFKLTNTVILIDTNGYYFKSEAALQIARNLNYPWKSFYFLRFIPKFIRDKIYDLIAKHRYNWFGKRDSCMIPTSEIKSRFLD